MTFEEKSELGLAGERLVAAVYQRDKTLSVKLNTGKDALGNGWSGVSWHNDHGVLVTPDFDIKRRRGFLTGSLAELPDFVAEVKTKSVFACCENADCEVRTGIDVAAYFNYIEYNMTYPGGFFFDFVHIFAVKQIREDYSLDQDSTAGIYRADIKKLKKESIRQSQGVSNPGEMVYWSIESFQLTNTLHELSQAPDTSMLVKNLRKLAWLRLPEEKQVKIVAAYGDRMPWGCI
jgi:hypothetical protein